MNLAIYHQARNGWKVWIKNGRLPLIKEEFCINDFITAAKVILEAKGCEVNADGKFLFEERTREVLKHVSCFSFYYEDVLYVPYPLESTQDLTITPEEEKVMSSRWEMSKNYHFEPFKIFDLHDHPDYLLLNCLDTPPCPEVYDALYLGFFMKRQEKWNIYYMHQGQSPSPEAVSSARGLIITGSRHCSYDLSQPWKQALYSLISSCSTLNKCIVGICFGHQAISRAFGGDTSRNPSRHYVYSAETLLGSQSLRLMESHGDCVSTLPGSFRKLHHSASCEVESMEFGRKVLSFQAHPEYTLEFIQKYHSIGMKSRGSITEEKFEEIQKISDEFDSSLAIDHINKYLRGQDNIFYY